MFGRETCSNVAILLNKLPLEGRGLGGGLPSLPPGGLTAISPNSFTRLGLTDMPPLSMPIVSFSAQCETLQTMINLQSGTNSTSYCKY